MIEIKRISADETLWIRQQVLWPSKPLEYVKIENDDEGLHFGLFEDNQLRTVISVFINSKEAQFRKFATLAAYRGRGYGSMIFEFMLAELEKQEIDRIWCNARLEANAFYKRYDFKVAEGKNFTKGNVAYTIMERYA